MAISFTGQLFILSGTTQWRTQLDMHLVWHIPGSSCYKVRLLSMQHYCFSQAEIIINSTIFSRMHCALLKLYYNTICLVYQTYIFVKIFHHDSEVLFFSNDDRDSSASGVINIANVVFCDTPEK